MIYLRNGEHTEGGLRAPIHNYHLLALRLEPAGGGALRALVTCLRCDAVSGIDTIADTYAPDCPRKNDP